MTSYASPKAGILIFNKIQDALHAGYSIESPYPDSEGFLHARMRTATALAMALVRMKAEIRNGR